MSKKHRYFVIISHCILNPSTRVQVLGKRFELSKKIVDFFLEKHISIIQLPCPEFTALGYLRNPQGRQQYDSIFFRKHCAKELESYVDMIMELSKNNNTPLCYIGVQGSPTCSIVWGKHKINKYKTESIMQDEDCSECTMDSKKDDFGVMTFVLDKMLKDRGIFIPYLEAPSKECIDSQKSIKFFNDLNDLLNIPEEYR